jgi:serine/threonine protein phosphatase PrpC
MARPRSPIQLTLPSSPKYPPIKLPSLQSSIQIPTYYPIYQTRLPPLIQSPSRPVQPLIRSPIRSQIQPPIQSSIQSPIHPQIPPIQSSIQSSIRSPIHHQIPPIQSSIRSPIRSQIQSQIQSQIPPVKSLIRSQIPPVQSSIRSPIRSQIQSQIPLVRSPIRSKIPVVQRSPIKLSYEQNRGLRPQSPRSSRIVEYPSGSKDAVTEIQLDVRDFNDGYTVAQQQQRSHEDAYQIKLLGPFRYFAIFDGHGSKEGLTNNHVSIFARNHLHNALVHAFQTINFNDELEVKYAIINVFANFDAEMFEKGYIYGTTCTIVLIDDVNDKIYQINLGDSRSILFNEANIVSETIDHSPIDIQEYNQMINRGIVIHPVRIAETKRIIEADGYVNRNRVDGRLAVSRAFGDFEYKVYDDHDYHPYTNKVSTFPDIIVTPKRLVKHFILTSDAPFEGQRYNNDSLVSLANNSVGNVAYEMVRKIKPDTTDDITIIYGNVDIPIPF